MANWDVIKWIRRVYVTAGTTVDISAYNTNYMIRQIVINPLYGTQWKIQIGFTAGGSEVCEETDISHLATGKPICLSINQVSAAGQNTLHFTMPIGNIDVDIQFVQYIGA
jgi:hypothetical protein